MDFETSATRIIVEKLNNENEILLEGLHNIRRYLNSEKFSQDIMVNKNDILLRIQETLNELDSVN